MSASRPSAPPTRWLTLTGLAFGGAIFLEAVARELGVLTAGSAFLLSGEFLIGVVTCLPFIGGFVYADYWLVDREIEPRHYRTVWRRILEGGAVWVVVNLALTAVMPPENWATFIAWIRWAVVTGCGIGLTLGLVQARAVQNAVEAERNAVRADMLESQRDVLTYLNSLLRHEVLNGTNVIAGYAELLEGEYDAGEPPHEYGGIIRGHSEDIASVIENVRAFLALLQDSESVHEYDLGSNLPDLVERANQLDEGADVEYEGPDHARVVATELVDRALWNVVSNAVLHNDAPVTVGVGLSEADDGWRITVTDDGTGIDPEMLDTLFERPESNLSRGGFGLYLTRQLVEAFDGEIRLAETGPEGTTMVMTLPRATAEPGEAIGEKTARPRLETPRS